MPQTPCPYCGQPHDTSDVGRCSNCNGLFEPLSQIATQLAMGPWYVRDEDRPFMPGFNEAILRQQVAAGRINANTIVRGPTTNQFWMSAADTPGVSRLMGTCHACHDAVSPSDTQCKHCQADLSLPDDVDQLGLRYTTAEQRAQAQQEIIQGRSAMPAPTPKPQPKPAAPKPAAPKVMQGSTIVPPEQLQPIEPKLADAAGVEASAHETQDGEMHDGGNALTDALAEDVWHAGAASPSRRRKRAKGADPLVVGMAVMLLCVVALGMLIILTSGNKRAEDDADEQPASPAVVQRDTVSVSRVSVPALTAYERLQPDDIPTAFQEQYQAIRRLVQQAEADKKAERYNEAYDAYKEISERVAPLEVEIEAWRANEQAKADATALRTRIGQMREQAQAAEAERWAAKDWQEAQSTTEQAEQRFAAGQFTEATELFAQAESTYLSAGNKAQAGQAAGNARTTLIDAMKSSASEQSLRAFAEDQLEAMLRLRAEANQQLNDGYYAQAEQSYNDALDALREAQQIVELARYKKFYAFDAGFRASSLMLAAARGDGVQAEEQQALAEVFEKLRLLPNPASNITPGNEVGFTVAIEPLVNGARDAIIQQHGEATQACYLIGFHASIIDQTLKTTSLTDGQQKRIHQSLGTIEEQAQKAGWNIDKLRPIVDQVRIANRNANLKQDPAATRTAWKRLLNPMQSPSTAPALMDPTLATSEPRDPELFPE